MGEVLRPHPWESDIRYRYRVEQKGESEGAKQPRARAAACIGKDESAA